MKYLTILLIVFAFRMEAQQSLFLGYFSVVQNNNNLFAEWMTLPGVTCQDLKLQHSANRENFTTIYIIPGVCGHSSTSVTYTYEHEDPRINQLNYYRLDMGTYGFSDTLCIQHVQDGLAIFPQPSYGSTYILYENPANIPFELTIFDINGKPVLKKTNSAGVMFQLADQEIPSGAYLFIIQNLKDGEKRSGKFILN